jgi:hypothetical protein
MGEDVCRKKAGDILRRLFFRAAGQCDVAAAGWSVCGVAAAGRSVCRAVAACRFRGLKNRQLTKFELTVQFY